MFGVYPPMPKVDQDLDCTDEEWAAFIKRVEEMGEEEIQKMIERQKAGVAEPAPVKETNPSLQYYWHHLMGGGDQ